MDLTILISVAVLAALVLLSWILTVGGHRRADPPLATEAIACEYCGVILGTRTYHKGITLRSLFFCDSHCYAGFLRRAEREEALKRNG